jgi:hypothetical protein
MEEPVIFYTHRLASTAFKTHEIDSLLSIYVAEHDIAISDIVGIWHNQGLGTPLSGVYVTHIDRPGYQASREKGQQ